MIVNPPQPFTFERLSPETARQDYPALWQTTFDHLPHLSDEERAIVVSLVVDTCPYCHEHDRTCQCWNDE